MVILECLPGFEVTVRVEDKPLVEYDDYAENDDLREKIEEDISRLKNLGEVEVIVRRVALIKGLTPAQVRKHRARLAMPLPLKEKLDREVHREAVNRGGNLSKALLVIPWDNAEPKREPVIKLESDDEDVVEDVEKSPAATIKREREEDMAESSISAKKRGSIEEKKKGNQIRSEESY
ncbi:hypothetical protein NHQ30_003206 [Ciborinia camelliae]|nr:hypothetical protein NHQ30_003206 [Ciborinia camelliae]